MATAASYFVKNLPGMPESSTLSLYAGQIPVGDDDGEMFFLLAKNRHKADKERTLVWFNGGPGCSSFDGSFMEVGPLRVEIGKEGKLREAAGAWNEYANILFIDQPLGTGYSTVNSNGYMRELDEAADNVIAFMKKWYEIFPEHARQDTYLTGESFAGMYIPYIARAWLESDLRAPLRGLLIGNGWMDPLTQYPAYLDFALQSGLVKSGSQLEQLLITDVAKCNETMALDGHEPLHINYGPCEQTYMDIRESTVQSVNGKQMCVNTYDVRLTDTHPECGMNWPADLKDLKPYLNREDVRDALHASTATNWEECSSRVANSLVMNKSPPSVGIMPHLLEKIPILLFAGDQDLICNHIGIENMIERLSWNGLTGFQDAPRLSWTVDGNDAGYWQSARNLTYVNVKDSSHMVPYDKPLVAHDMLLRFLNVDLMNAAGPAAKIPSRLGDEKEVLVGGTHPNGSAIFSPSPSSSEHTPSPSPPPDKSNYTLFPDVPPALLVLLFLSLAALFAYVYRAQIRRRLSKAAHSLSHGRHRRGPSAASRYEPVHADDPELAQWELDSIEPRQHEAARAPPRDEEIFKLADDDDDTPM